MSTTITSAGTLVEDPDAQRTYESKPFVTSRVLVNRPVKVDAGVGGQRAHPAQREGLRYRGEQSLRLRRPGDRIMVHGLLRIESWIDKETGEKGNRKVVVVDNWFGEVGGSFKYAPARVDCRSTAAAMAPDRLRRGTRWMSSSRHPTSCSRRCPRARFGPEVSIGMSSESRLEGS